MNRKFLLTKFFLLLFMVVHSQVQVNSMALPMIGDSFALSTVTNLDNFEVAAPGLGAIYDYEELTDLLDLDHQRIFLDPFGTPGAPEFSQADLFSPADEGGIYYEKTDSSVNILGVITLDPLGFGITVTGKYYPPLLFKKAPLSYLDSFMQFSELLLPVSSDVIPDTLLNMLPLTPDSLRARLTFQSNTLADGSGFLRIGEQNIPVLRTKTVGSQKIDVDAKFPFLGWIEVSDFFTIPIPVDTNENTSYSYYSEDGHFPLMTLTLDTNDDPESATYRMDIITPSYEIYTDRDPGIYVTPNPTYGAVTFEFVDLPPGKYTIELLNILGMLVWKDEFFTDHQDKVLPADLRNLKRGSYFYRVRDMSDNILSTKRLIIISP